jgi:U1 small nuclear ribonucleoprotein C
MPKYYCDYCDTHLTHDSPSVRKTHCSGRKHKENVKFYYQKWMEDQVRPMSSFYCSTQLYCSYFCHSVFFKCFYYIYV